MQHEWKLKNIFKLHEEKQWHKSSQCKHMATKTWSRLNVYL